MKSIYIYLIDLNILPLEIWHKLYCHNFENYLENCERGDTYDYFIHMIMPYK